LELRKLVAHPTALNQVHQVHRFSESGFFRSNWQATSRLAEAQIDADANGQSRVL